VNDKIPPRGRIIRDLPVMTPRQVMDHFAKQKDAGQDPGRVHEGYLPVIKLGALNRFDAGSIRDWLRKREAAGRPQRRLDVDV